MSLESQIKKLGELVDDAKTILVLQPEKPDTDSLTSSLALEFILSEMGKEVVLYCQDNVPNYISYFSGADRVTDEFPSKFDLTLLVDTGGPGSISRTLEKYQGKLVKKPFIVIDHHANREPMPFDTIDVIDIEAVATCEQVLKISKQLGWKLSANVAKLLIPGILADTRNLSISTVESSTFRLMAELLDYGVDIYSMHEQYRLAGAVDPSLLHLKGALLSRAEFFKDGKIALVMVTPTELKNYADIHDPADLVVYELQRAKGVEVAVVIRHYGGESNKIKISTRANMPVAAKACREFGGGGHDRAAGCQVMNTPASEVKEKFVTVLSKCIEDYENIQHADETKRNSQTA